MEWTAPLPPSGRHLDLSTSKRRGVAGNRLHVPPTPPHDHLENPRRSVLDLWLGPPSWDLWLGKVVARPGGALTDCRNPAEDAGIGKRVESLEEPTLCGCMVA
jgi:hypothetical protein